MSPVPLPNGTGHVLPVATGLTPLFAGLGRNWFSSARAGKAPAVLALGDGAFACQARCSCVALAFGDVTCANIRS